MRKLQIAARSALQWRFQLKLAVPVLLLASGCKGEFTGPYPCETGYDSCISPERNFCETDITTDAANCGACGKACAVGALCNDGECQPGAQKLASLTTSSVPSIAVNSTGVYFSSLDQSEIMTVPVTGGTSTAAASNVSGCGQELAFALNDTFLFYWSNSGGLYTASIPGGAPAMLASSSALGNVCPTSMALNSSHVLLTGNQNNNTAVLSVSIKDGTFLTLANFQGNTNGLAVTDKQILFGLSNNGPRKLESLPVDGTSSSPNEILTTVGGQSNGFTSFVANNNFAFMASGGCPCNGNDNASQGVLPTGRVDRFTLQGGEGTKIAQFSGIANSMALDSTFVYWATDTTVWKAPIAGGPAIRLAGNLAKGTTPLLCFNMCNTPVNTTLSIAVDNQNVYIADASPNVNAILKVKK